MTASSSTDYPHKNIITNMYLICKKINKLHITLMKRPHVSYNNTILNNDRKILLIFFVLLPTKQKKHRNVNCCMFLFIMHKLLICKAIQFNHMLYSILFFKCFCSFQKYFMWNNLLPYNLEHQTLTYISHFLL